MAITKFNESVNNIQNLADNPNTSGMTAAELKATFDKAGSDIKTYINDTLTEELDDVNSATDSSIGTLSNLTTSAKTNLVSAINEVDTQSSASTILNLVYPVGSIYMSVNNVSPSSFIGGTWTKITSDAYLKIVSSNAGSLGGTSSNHKIPLSSIPSHSHSFGKYVMSSNKSWSGDNTSMQSGNEHIKIHTPTNADISNITGTQSSGGGSAYYPYYLGIYVWKRVS